MNFNEIDGAFKYSVKMTAKFKKDLKLMKKRGLKLDLLSEVILKLAKGDVLPPVYREHELSGKWAGFRECHIQPDWLLVYYILDDVLVLTLARTGTHSDLFKE